MAEFTVYLKTDYGLRELPEGMRYHITTESPEIDAVYVPIECQQCGTVQIEWGDFRHVATYREPMGKEKHHESEFLRTCECGSEVHARIRYFEYPAGALQPLEFDSIENAEYVDVGNLANFARSSVEGEVTRRVNETQERLQRLEAKIDFGELVESDFESLFEAIIETVSNPVLVLGNYDSPEKELLREIQMELGTIGFQSKLVEDLGDDTAKTPPQNVEAAMLLSQFCVMLDTERASGHNNEYELVKNHDAVLARLVPGSGGSSAMQGGEEFIDRNHIRSFEYTESPLDILEDAVEWAVEYNAKKRERYPEEWRWYES